MEDSDQSPVIVIDNGSGYIKAGFSNQSTPEIFIPAVIGRPMLRYGEKLNIDQIKSEKNKSEQKKLIKQMIKEHYLKDIMVGDEIIGFRSLLEITHPTSDGIIVNEEDLTRLWEYTFNEKLGLKGKDLSDRKVIVTEAPLNPLDNKKKFLKFYSKKWV